MNLARVDMTGRPAPLIPAAARELFIRCPTNPLLTAAQWPYPINTVFNPGAAMVNGQTVLLCRVEDRRGISHLTVARSADGVTGWQIDPKPLIAADQLDDATRWGVEDPRVTRVDELDSWLITYTAYGPNGPSVALATTRDFACVEHLGVVASAPDKDASLLSRRVAGQFVLFHRPMPRASGRSDIWLSRSSDLRCWTEPEPVLAARPGAWWDCVGIGMGPPPLDTPHGWLAIYHGVKYVAAGTVYRMGVALLDHDNPATVLHRSDEWILAPQDPYELAGNATNVVFPTGLLHDPATDQLRLYYGAADSSIALATATLSDLLAYTLSWPGPGPTRRW
jgi:beta-1,2-mannobiose phosphorylase / 1,2-beta-oligomannan phosphorylase